MQVFNDDLKGLVINGLTIIGWTGEKQGSCKMYAVYCENCAKDPELFGEAIFKSTLNSLNKGSKPCGCSNMHWTTEQYKILIARQLQDSIFTIDYRDALVLKSYTKVLITCTKHGSTKTIKVSDVVLGRKPCEECKSEKQSQRCRKNDNEIIQKFLQSGVFSDDVIFKRSERLDSYGHRRYWSVYCPECDMWADATHTNLKKGQKPCECKPMPIRFAYINLIKDGSLDLALKFGISSKPELRLKSISYKTSLMIENLGVWNFQDESSCRKAELECKWKIPCSVLDSQLLPDGWTETTYIYELDNIISIYEKFGGKLIK